MSQATDEDNVPNIAKQIKVKKKRKKENEVIFALPEL